MYRRRRACGEIIPTADGSMAGDAPVCIAVYRLHSAGVCVRGRLDSGDACALRWRSDLMSRLLKRLVVAAFVAGAVVSASRARAGYTAVKQPKRGAGPSHERILESVYGGNFVADAAGLSFSNESGVTVTRVEDGAGGGEGWAGERKKTPAVGGAGGM